MAQKVAAPSLRLNINRHFKACWFSDRVYAEIFHKNFKTLKFLNAIFSFLGNRSTISHFQATPKNIFIHSFFCNPRSFDEKLLTKSYTLTSNEFFKQYHASFEGKETIKKNNFLYTFFLLNQTKTWTTFSKKALLKSCLLYIHEKQQQKQKVFTVPISSLFHDIKMSQIEAPARQTTVNFYQQHIQTILSSYLKTPVTWQTNKMTSMYKSAEFVSEFIALCFEQNKSFRQIFRQVLKEVKKESLITGIRIACAGRLNGAEMARVETKRYGQTSLHVFSNRIDYHSTSAYTSYGLIGVKVWISYKK